MTIEAGTYSVILTGAQLSETKNGDPIISVTVRHAPSSPHAGHADVWDGWLNNDKAFETTGRTLRECLWTGDDIEHVTFPENTIAQAVYQPGNDGVVRLKYLNGPGRAPRNKPLSEDKVADVKARMRAFLGTATAAPAVPERLRPFLAAVAAVKDAQGGARLWKQFESQRGSWSSDEVSHAWKTLCVKAPGAEIKAAVEAMKVKPTAAQQEDAPPF